MCAKRSPGKEEMSKEDIATDIADKVEETSREWLDRRKGASFEIAASKNLARLAIAHQIGRVADALEKIADNSED